MDFYEFVLHMIFMHYFLHMIFMHYFFHMIFDDFYNEGNSCTKKMSIPDLIYIHTYENNKTYCSFLYTRVMTTINNLHFKTYKI